MPVIVAAAVVAAIRIVSLAPALTEDLFAIGAGPQIVGVDTFSDRPVAARTIARVGGMRDVNSEAILALRPDIVVGVPYEAAHLADISRGGIKTEALQLDTLADDLQAMTQLGILTGHASQAQRLVRSLEARLSKIRAAAKHTRRLSAFVQLGAMGSAGGGSYIDDLLGLANLKNIAGDIKRPWITFSPEELLRAQPDVIVVTDNGAALVGDPWDRLDAVRAGRVLRVPEDDLLRPGPQLADVLDAIVKGVAPWR